MPRLNLIIFGKTLCQDFTWVILLTTKELTLRISFTYRGSCVRLKLNPLSRQMIINMQGVKLNMNWHDKSTKKKKEKNAAWAFSGTQWSVTAVIWYLSYQRTKEVRYMSACTNTHVRAPNTRVSLRVCVYFCLCMTDALLIKLMDSARTLLCLLSPLSLLSLSLFAPCALPLKQSIHSSSKYFFLTSQEKSIIGQRGEKPGRVARGGTGTGGRHKGSRISGRSERGLCFVNGGGGGAGLHRERKWNGIHFVCFCVCVLAIIHAWVLNGSAVLHGWVNTYLPHNYTFFFLLSLLSFICLGFAMVWHICHGLPIPHTRFLHNADLLLHHALIWWAGWKKVHSLTTNQHSHGKEQRAKGTNNNMLWLKAQVLLVGLPRGLGPLCSCTAC